MSSTASETLRANMLYNLRKARVSDEQMAECELAFDLLTDAMDGSKESIRPQSWAYILLGWSNWLKKELKWPAEL